MSSRENLFAPVPVAAIRLAAAPTVLVVDDNAAMREGLLRLLQSAATTWGEVVAVGSLGEARHTASRLQPGLVLLDLDLAGDDGLSLIADLPSFSQVLVLSSHGDAATRERALRMGAEALVDKRETGEHLLALICRMASPNSQGDQAPIATGS